MVAAHALPLLVFTFVATLPFALALSQLVLVVVAVAWLAAIGFTIPVSVAEEPPEELDLLHRLGFDLRRSIELARAEYLHAVGVIAALVLLYVLLSIVLIGALRASRRTARSSPSRSRRSSSRRSSTSASPSSTSTRGRGRYPRGRAT